MYLIITHLDHLHWWSLSGVSKEKEKKNKWKNGKKGRSGTHYGCLRNGKEPYVAVFRWTLCFLCLSPSQKKNQSSSLSYTFVFSLLSLSSLSSVYFLLIYWLVPIRVLYWWTCSYKLRKNVSISKTSFMGWSKSRPIHNHKNSYIWDNEVKCSEKIEHFTISFSIDEDVISPLTIFNTVQFANPKRI